MNTRYEDTSILGISQVLMSRNTHIEWLFEALRVRKDRGRQYHLDEEGYGPNPKARG